MAEALRLWVQWSATLVWCRKGRSRWRIPNATSDGRLEAFIVDVVALSPVQQRDLKKAWRYRAPGRTALILQIFGEWRIRGGRLQVELAAVSTCRWKRGYPSLSLTNMLRI